MGCSHVATAAGLGQAQRNLSYLLFNAMQDYYHHHVQKGWHSSAFSLCNDPAFLCQVAAVALDAVTRAAARAHASLLTAAPDTFSCCWQQPQQRQQPARSGAARLGSHWVPRGRPAGCSGIAGSPHNRHSRAGSAPHTTDCGLSNASHCSVSLSTEACVHTAGSWPLHPMWAGSRTCGVHTSRPVPSAPQCTAAAAPSAQQRRARTPLHTPAHAAALISSQPRQPRPRCTATRQT